MSFNSKSLYAEVAESAGIFRLSEADLARLHIVQLEILDDLIAVCKSEGLTVMLQAGTLIGAVLHKGFIPWDDDIDLFMPRNDYNRLMEVFPEKMGHKYFLQSPYTEPDASFGFIKIRKKNTAFVELETAGFPINKGIFIDIAPLENAPDNRIKRFSHGMGCIILRQITISCGLYKNPSGPLKVLRKHSKRLNVLLTIREVFGFLFSLMDVGRWNQITDRFCARYQHTKTGFIVSPYSPTWGYFRETYRRELFFPSAILEFEGRKIEVPAAYDRVLKEKYGTITASVPPKKRTQHWVVDLDFGD